MKYLVIRDDDISYWTKPEEIERVYKPLFEKGIKVSFAVIPKSVKMFYPGDFEKMYQDEKSAVSIGENEEITVYVRDLVEKERAEIMLHGYNHLYFISVNDKKYIANKENLDRFRKERANITFLGEYMDAYEVLYEKTRKGRRYLETLFDMRIKNFVPPSNQIAREGVNAVSQNGLNISGIAGRRYDRESNITGFYAYLKRIVFKLKHKNITYPFIIDYKDHKELAGYAFTPSTDWKRYERQLEFCAQNNLPFQLATHYWELKGALLDRFYEFIDYALSKGFKSAFLKDVLK